MKDAGLEVHRGPCSFNIWVKFQAILPNYQIKVFSKEWLKDLPYKDHQCYMQPNKEEEDEDISTPATDWNKGPKAQ
uniref:Uncharacterized protein n=1 Tax=Romanomermis culicivorax TaxID=13658 RepID=A0A915IP31_ROMCU